MKTIIVDDEPKAIELIASYLSHFSDFELVHTFRNGLKALEYLNTTPVDVIFLDINMPHLSGLSLSKMVAPKTSIVFTTAYAEHALESYDVSATDYLLKPISLERFSKTITKLMDLRKMEELDASKPTNIFVKSGVESHQLEVNGILYLKKDGNYIHYITNDKKVMARQTTAEALNSLTGNFIQIQKSFIVNLRKIESVSSEWVVVGGQKIPIGAQYKGDLMDRIRLSS